MEKEPITPQGLEKLKKELEELKVILIRKDWIVHAYLNDREVYVSTEYGLGMYIAFCHWTEYGHKLEFTDMERPIFKKEEQEKSRYFGKKIAKKSRHFGKNRQKITVFWQNREKTRKNPPKSKKIKCRYGPDSIIADLDDN